MKKSILSLVTMIVLGTGVMNGKTKIIVVEKEQPRHEQTIHHDSHHNDKHHNGKHVKKHHKTPKCSGGLAIPKNQITYSQQTLRF